MDRFFQPYGQWTEYYENGRVKSTGSYYPYSFEAIGQWKYFYPNGQLHTLYSIDMVEVDSVTSFCKAGRFEEYYENGQLKVSGWYGIAMEATLIEQMNYTTLSYEKVKGLKPISKPIGEWIFYKPNGEIERKGYGENSR